MFFFHPASTFIIASESVRGKNIKSLLITHRQKPNLSRRSEERRGKREKKITLVRKEKEEKKIRGKKGKRR